jgi:hypothetical protein
LQINNPNQNNRIEGVFSRIVFHYLSCPISAKDTGYVRVLMGQQPGNEK